MRDTGRVCQGDAKLTEGTLGRMRGVSSAGESQPTRFSGTLGQMRGVSSAGESQPTCFSVSPKAETRCDAIAIVVRFVPGPGDRSERACGSQVCNAASDNSCTVLACNWLKLDRQLGKRKATHFFQTPLALNSAKNSCTKTDLFERLQLLNVDGRLHQR